MSSEFKVDQTVWKIQAWQEQISLVGPRGIREMRNGCYDLGGTRSIKDIIEQADSVLARVRAWWSAYSFGRPKRTKVACLGVIRQWNRSKLCFHTEPNHTEERQFFLSVSCSMIQKRAKFAFVFFSNQKYIFQKFHDEQRIFDVNLYSITGHHWSSTTLFLLDQ